MSLLAEIHAMYSGKSPKKTVTVISKTADSTQSITNSRGQLKHQGCLFVCFLKSDYNS